MLITKSRRMFLKERLKQLKKKIYRYFTDIHSYRYIDRLRGFAEGYSQAVHRTIYMPLEDITKDNEETTYINVFDRTKRAPCKKIKHLRYRFNIGDSVRRPHLRNIFTLQYDEKWTGEIFTVAQRFWRQSAPYTESRIILERILRWHFINLTYIKLRWEIEMDGKYRMCSGQKEKDELNSTLLNGYIGLHNLIIGWKLLMYMIYTCVIKDIFIILCVIFKSRIQYKPYMYTYLERFGFLQRCYSYLQIDVPTTTMI